jgi:hypothetical protein
MAIWGVSQAPQVVADTEDKQGQKKTKYKNNLGQPIALTASSAADNRGGGPQGVGPTRPTAAAPIAAPLGADTGRYIAATSEQLAMQKAMANMNKRATDYQNALGEKDYSLSGVGEDGPVSGVVDTDIFKDVRAIDRDVYDRATANYGTADLASNQSVVKRAMEEALKTQLDEQYNSAIAALTEDRTAQSDILEGLRGDYESVARPSVFDMDTSNLTDLEKRALSRRMANERSTGSLGAYQAADISLGGAGESYDATEVAIEALRKQYEQEVADASSIGSAQISDYIKARLEFDQWGNTAGKSVADSLTGGTGYAAAEKIGYTDLYGNVNYPYKVDKFGNRVTEQGDPYPAHLGNNYAPTRRS